MELRQARRFVGADRRGRSECGEHRQQRERDTQRYQALTTGSTSFA